MMPPVCRASKSSAFDIPNSLLNLLIACHAADHGDFNPGMLRDAQVFFERARILDPDNEFAASWIEKVSRILSFAVITTLMKTISQQQSSGPRNSPDSDEEPEKIQSDDAEQRNKRMRR